MPGWIIVAVVGISLLSLLAALRLALARPPLTRRLASYRHLPVAPDSRDRRAHASFGRRVVAPLAGTVAGSAVRFMPSRARSRLQARLDAAGNPGGLTSSMLSVLSLLLTVLCGLLVPAVAAILGVGMSPMLAIATFALALLGSRLPGFWLSRRVGRRRRMIRRELPDALDMIVVSVEAGLGLDAALARVTEKTRGPLAADLHRALEDIRLGRSRKQALVEAAERSQVPEFRQFVAAVIQTMEVGGDLGDVLRIQAETARTRRRQRAQEQAMKAPVKMVFPLVLLVFPSLFIVLLAPAALRALEIFR